MDNLLAGPGGVDSLVLDPGLGGGLGPELRNQSSVGTRQPSQSFVGTGMSQSLGGVGTSQSLVGMGMSQTQLLGISPGGSPLPEIIMTSTAQPVAG